MKVQLPRIELTDEEVVAIGLALEKIDIPVVEDGDEEGQAEFSRILETAEGDARILWSIYLRSLRIEDVLTRENKRSPVCSSTRGGRATCIKSARRVFGRHPTGTDQITFLVSMGVASDVARSVASSVDRDLRTFR